MEKARLLFLTTETAANALLKNELVVMPTETVYGLAANALSLEAVNKIYSTKKRNAANPLIIHFSRPDQIVEHCEVNNDFFKLASSFWPGPLTLVLKKKLNTPIKANTELDTLAVRIPNHPLALKLIETAGVPISAPSANVSGEVSPTCTHDLSINIIKHIAGIIEGGAAERGIESTVLDISIPPYTILRPGFISKEQIELTLNKKINIRKTEEIADSSIKSPGIAFRHYSPNTPLRMNVTDIKNSNEALLAYGPPITGAKYTLNLSERSNIEEAAHNLYHFLIKLDSMGFSSIAVMPIPNEGIGTAINDRLKRAAGYPEAAKPERTA